MANASPKKAGNKGEIDVPKIRSTKIQAPIEVEIKVHITNGKSRGIATIGVGKGCYPTEARMRGVIKLFERDSMPAGYRLMNKHEWFNTIMPHTQEEDEDGNMVTNTWAAPGGDAWDK
jgi:hypothetical protein